MQRERITDNILVFRSDLYAQVTAGVVLTSAGAVLIDTLLYPEESQRIRRFVETGLGCEIVYVINTHFHADHTTGTCFFPGAQVISHRLVPGSSGYTRARRLTSLEIFFGGV